VARKGGPGIWKKKKKRTKFEAARKEIRLEEKKKGLTDRGMRVDARQVKHLQGL